MQKTILVAIFIIFSVFGYGKDKSTSLNESVEIKKLNNEIKILEENVSNLSLALKEANEKVNQLEKGKIYIEAKQGYFTDIISLTLCGITVFIGIISSLIGIVYWNKAQDSVRQFDKKKKELEESIEEKVKTLTNTLEDSKIKISKSIEKNEELELQINAAVGNVEAHSLYIQGRAFEAFTTCHTSLLSSLKKRNKFHCDDIGDIKIFFINLTDIIRYIDYFNINNLGQTELQKKEELIEREKLEIKSLGKVYADISEVYEKIMELYMHRLEIAKKGEAISQEEWSKINDLLEKIQIKETL